MRKENLQFVRQQLRGLRAAFDDPIDGKTGSTPYDRIVTIRHLCRAASEAVDDNRCREQLDLMELYAGDLFSEGDALWQRRSQVDVQSIKQKIRQCFSAIDRHLAALETAVAAG